MYVTISVPATHDGIWNLITKLPSDSFDIVIVFMYDQVGVNSSHSTDFHTNPQDKFFSHFGDIACSCPLSHPQLALFCSTTLRIFGLCLKDST